jgi:LysM repeat protein
MKKYLMIVSFLGMVSVAKSQNLTVEGSAPNLYITHTVAPKENFYSVGRLYNQNPKAIAAFNNLVMEKGLTIGQKVKIPLNDQNLDVTGNANVGETVPLTHVVGKSETLSKIGADLNVPAQSIKQWNSLSSDNIAPGTPLVVGHLKMSSPPAVSKAVSISQSPSQTAPAKQTDAEQANVATEPKKMEAPATASQAPEAPKKETPVKEENVKQAEPLANATTKEEPVKETPVKKQTTANAETTSRSETYSYANTGSMGSVEGVFANVFTTGEAAGSLSTKSGEAGTFKSTSGWQDKKYYVLINDVNPGTIVKIESAENKVIYAKVLGSMPEMKENNGLLLRMSNAAASYLGIIDPRFPVQISYYQ